MNRLRELRKKAKMTQEQLAAALSVTNGAISQWEVGRTLINYRHAVKLAELFNCTPEYLLGESNDYSSVELNSKTGFRIPVLGTIRAGIPVAAIEEIEDWEEISAAQAKTGEFVALRIKGASMEPKISDGDIAIIRRQETIESGQIAAVLVNGEEATIKKVKLLPDGLMLIAFNDSVYEPRYYSAQEIADLPVRIYGRLVEVRRKF